jgi:hypothetical protein
MRCDLGFSLMNPNVGISIGPTVALGATVGFRPRQDIFYLLPTI